MKKDKHIYFESGSKAVIEDGDEFLSRDDADRSKFKWVPCISSIGCRAELMSTEPNDIRRPITTS
jgi:hypothetical protein